VPAHSFGGISLTDRELKTALFVFYIKAQHACHEDSKGKFVIALGIYNTTVAHYGRTTDCDVNSRKLFTGGFVGC